MITNEFRRSEEVLADKQSEQSADEFNNEFLAEQQQSQSVFSSVDQSFQMKRAQIQNQMMIPSRDNVGQPTDFERLNPVRLGPGRTSPIQSTSSIVQSHVLKRSTQGQSLLQNRDQWTVMTPLNLPNRTTNRSVCAICNKKFGNQIQLQFHIKKVSYNEKKINFSNNIVESCQSD